MTKPWKLTRQAETSLREIADWTFETFGPGQTKAYIEDLIARCEAIAAKQVITYSCNQVLDRPVAGDIRFTRFGQHYIIYLEQTERVVIIDFLHSRSNLPARLADLDQSRNH